MDASPYDSIGRRRAGGGAGGGAGELDDSVGPMSPTPSAELDHTLRQPDTPTADFATNRARAASIASPAISRAVGATPYEINPRRQLSGVSAVEDTNGQPSGSQLTASHYSMEARRRQRQASAVTGGSTAAVGAAAVGASPCEIAERRQMSSMALPSQPPPSPGGGGSSFGGPVGSSWSSSLRTRSYDSPSVESRSFDSMGQRGGAMSDATGLALLPDPSEEIMALLHTRSSGATEEWGGGDADSRAETEPPPWSMSERRFQSEPTGGTEGRILARMHALTAAHDRAAATSAAAVEPYAVASAQTSVRLLHHLRCGPSPPPTPKEGKKRENRNGRQSRSLTRRRPRPPQLCQRVGALPDQVPECAAVAAHHLQPASGLQSGGRRWAADGQRAVRGAAGPAQQLGPANDGPSPH